MTLPRTLMLIGLVILPVGMLYSMTTHASPQARQGSYVEHVCLVIGAGLFLLGRYLEKRGAGGS